MLLCKKKRAEFSHPYGRKRMECLTIKGIMTISFFLFLCAAPDSVAGEYFRPVSLFLAPALGGAPLSSLDPSRGPAQFRSELGRPELPPSAGRQRTMALRLGPGRPPLTWQPAAALMSPLHTRPAGDAAQEVSPEADPAQTLIGRRFIMADSPLSPPPPIGGCPTRREPLGVHSQYRSPLVILFLC